MTDMLSAHMRWQFVVPNYYEQCHTAHQAVGFTKRECNQFVSGFITLDLPELSCFPSKKSSVTQSMRGLNLTDYAYLENLPMTIPKRRQLSTQRITYLALPAQTLHMFGKVDFQNAHHGSKVCAPCFSKWIRATFLVVAFTARLTVPLPKHAHVQVPYRKPLFNSVRTVFKAFPGSFSTSRFLCPTLT